MDPVCLKATGGGAGSPVLRRKFPRLISMKQKEKILASGCLLGERVRYDAQVLKITDERIFRWAKEKRFIPICPECMGGLWVPRDPCEIEPGKTAQDVLDGKARILTQNGDDCTDDYLFGVQACVNMAKRHHVRLALLKQRSPACATQYVHDGHFNGQVVAGKGVLALALEREGILTFDETQLDQLENQLTD